MMDPLIKKLEAHRKQNNLSKYAVCKQLDISFLTYRRWVVSGHISIAYRELISNFLVQNSIQGKKGSQSSLTSDIAVIGIGCYYPGASSVAELWENIVARRVQFRRMLDQRLPLSDYYSDDTKAKDKTYLTKAAFIENFNFDSGKL